MIWPLAFEPLKRLIGSGIGRLYVCEANDSQQYAGLIRAHLASELSAHGVEVIGINQDNGSPFTARSLQRCLTRVMCDEGSPIRRAV